MTSVVNVNIPSEESKHWESAICNIMGGDGGILRCCYTFYCFPCAFGHMVNMMSPKDVVCGRCCCCACCCACNCCYHWSVRHAVRRKFGISGSDCGDCFAVCCCPCCAMCQEFSELSNHPDPPQNVTVVMMAPPAPPAYQPQPQYGPPRPA